MYCTQLMYSNLLVGKCLAKPAVYLTKELSANYGPLINNKIVHARE